MAILKSKDIKGMSEREIEEKVNYLRMELIKNGVGTKKNSGKIREIKRTLARLLTQSRTKSTNTSSVKKLVKNQKPKENKKQ